MKFSPHRAAQDLLSVANAFDLTVGEAAAHADNIFAILPLLNEKLTGPAFSANLNQCQLSAIDFDQLNSLLAKFLEHFKKKDKKI